MCHPASHDVSQAVQALSRTEGELRATASRLAALEDEHQHTCELLQQVRG